jgi:acetate---CoA ligase (ADP-forming)
VVKSNDNLTALFAPESVAIVGASDDPWKWGNWLAKQALSSKRPAYLVNARASTVLGQPTVASLRDIEGPVGLAVIAVPAGAFEATIDDALAIGVPAIVGISAGLGESGPEGKARELEIARRVREAGSVMLGPNCLGVYDSGSDLRLASNPLPPGRIAFISQSGNLSLELAKLLQDHALGFSRFASLGNQADLEAADLVAACADHDGTDAIAVYCEDFRDGRRFVDAARKANRSGKPVVLLTVGTSAAASRQAASHTASLVSDSSVVDAACEAAGVARVHTPRQMVDVLALLSTSMRPAGSRVAVLTDGGGHASIAADVAEAGGLSVPAFSDTLTATVAGELPPSAATVNPIDLAGGGEQDITSYARVTERVLESDEVDSLLFSGYFGGYAEYSEEIGPAELAVAKNLAQIAHVTGKGLVVHSMFPADESAVALREGGVPVYRTIEGAVHALSAVEQVRKVVDEPTAVVQAEPIADTDYWASRAALADAGLRFPGARLASSRAEVVAAASDLTFPVVLKAMGLLHKSDAGGVVLGLQSADELLNAYDAMQAKLQPPAVTVEEMADTSSGVELIVGARRDLRFGAVIMVGLGGIFTEVLADVSTALAPVDHSTAVSLLTRLRGAALLRGVRGRPAVDVDAAADAVVTISRFAAGHPEIAELEVNPLLVTASEAIALDARIIPTDEKGTS